MKNILVFGDSYSTFEGYIPEGYAPYYSTKEGVTDVRKVEETWWHQLANETGANLIMNNSWSGSTIGYTGYNNSDCSKSSSFIYRLNKLFEEGFFTENKIDTVFVFGGTNDSWSNAPVGDLKFSDITQNDLYKVLPATSFFIKRLKEILPDANIVFIINCDLKEKITTGITEAAEHYQINYIKLKEIDKTENHPTVKGMRQIKEQILQYLCENSIKIQ